MTKIEKLGFAIAVAAILIPVRSMAQAPAVPPDAASTWTFATDTSNNLVIQDLESLSTAPAGSIVGTPVCLRYFNSCPSNSDRRDSGLRTARARYSIRGADRSTEWRLEPGGATFREDGMVLSLQIGAEKGMAQALSSQGSWRASVKQVPASELRAGDGKRWNVFLILEGAQPAEGEGCWLELSCPVPGS